MSKGMITLEDIEALEDRLGNPDLTPVQIDGSNYEIECADPEIEWQGQRYTAFAILDERVHYVQEPVGFKHGRRAYQSRV